MFDPKLLDDEEPWVIPLHGIDAPRADTIAPVRSVSNDDAPLHLYTDDELPNIEFRPQLRRSA